jgi:hypothetical protein
MLLTSYERARRFLCLDDNSAKDRRILVTYINAVSANIEAYLDRKFEKISRTEYFNNDLNQREFWVGAPEISDIESVSVDPTGEFTGSETPLSNSFVGRSGNSIVLQYSQIPAKRGLKATYIGGVATTTSISTYTLTSVIGTFPVDSFIEGLESGAFGIIKTFNTVSGVMTVDVLYGVFKQAESLGLRSGEEDGLSNGISATLASVDSQSFVEVYPEIATACDIQVSYNVRTKSDFENSSVEQDKVSRRAMPTAKHQYNDLQPEVRSLINKFRRQVLY